MDHGADDGLDGAARARPTFGPMAVAGVGAVVGSFFQGRYQILDQLLRVERQAGGVGGTGGLAASALDAGVEAQQPVPVEIDRAFGAELAVGFEVEGTQRGVAAQAVVEAFRARMGDQMERAVDGVLQRPFQTPSTSSAQPQAPTNGGPRLSGQGSTPPAAWSSATTRKAAA